MNKIFSPTRFLPRFTLPALILLTAAAQFSRADDCLSDWHAQNDRVWIGPDYWANPLQDWRIAGGRLECAVSGGNRNVYLLTHESLPAKGTLTLSVSLGLITAADAASKPAKGWGGFRVGVKGTLPDYRNAAIHGKGLDAGVTTDGFLFVGKERAQKIALPMDGPVNLRFSAKPAANNRYRVTLEGHALDGDKKATVSVEIPADQLSGNFALVSHFDAAAANPKRKNKPTTGGSNRGGNVRYWFSKWKIAGDKVKARPGRALGPILWTQHTLSNGNLKMIANMPPLGAKDSQSVFLQVLEGDASSSPKSDKWKTLATEKIDPLSCTALFRMEKWDDKKDTPYRVAYEFNGKTHYWTGTIRKDPRDKDSLVVAGFTGNTDYLFPNARIARNVAIQDPDLLFFSGDQLYESVGGYGIQKTSQVSVETAALDYLRKWWLCGWAFREILRDRPAVFMPDDHDVYQGNIWGHNGRLAKIPGYADGGYHMDPKWVNMVHRTQTGHMPDPYDPTPLQRGISVYYTDMNYGGVSFAIVEDRKFKTGPATVLPDKGGRPDHVRPEDVDEKTWDPKTLDVPEAVLLGKRQLKFLDDWAADWTGAQFKCVLSQTIFCNLANYHGSNQQYLIADLDSNGWPQTGRDKALDAMRRGFAFHYAGDQHLASIVHHGVDEWNDAGWSFCVPSIAAGYPRSWLPDKEGRPVRNRPKPANLPNTGEYKEGLGNRVTVHAIANPAEKNRTKTQETLGHDKASGHGVVRFNKKDRTLTMECYRLLWDAKKPKPEDQFPGWPKTISVEDNYGRKASAHLPKLMVKGMTDPVVQVLEMPGEKVVYTRRIRGTAYRPRVFKANAKYSIIVGEPSQKKTKHLKDIRPTKDKNATLEVTF